MSIEKSLERIADALELYVSGVQTAPSPDSQPDTPPPAAKKTTKKKATTKPAAEPAGDKRTEDELRQVFQEFVGRKGSEEGTAALKELISGYGAANIGAIKPEDYAAIIKEVTAWK